MAEENDSTRAAVASVSSAIGGSLPKRGGVGAQPRLWTSDGFGGVAPTVELEARARLRRGDGHVTLWGMTARWSWGHGGRSSVWRG
jgi:hypothetical protein